MHRLVMMVPGASLAAVPAAAQVQPFPATFRIQEIAANGATIHVRAFHDGAD